MVFDDYNHDYDFDQFWDYEIPSLTKITLFYLHFMAIFMLSHLFSSYFILTELYFNPILPEKENSPSILFVFYFYFKPIFRHVRFIMQNTVECCKMYTTKCCTYAFLYLI